MTYHGHIDQDSIDSNDQIDYVHGTCGYYHGNPFNVAVGLLKFAGIIELIV